MVSTETKEKALISLTVRQALFVPYMYDPASESVGNGLKSARRAKYKGNDNTLKQTAHKLVTNGNIIKAKELYLAETKAEHIADRAERKQFWTNTMKTAPNMTDRLRASELLGKSECDFITVNYDMADEQQVLDQQRLAQAAVIAALVVANSNKPKQIKSEVVEDE